MNTPSRPPKPLLRGEAQFLFLLAQVRKHGLHRSDLMKESHERLSKRGKLIAKAILHPRKHPGSRSVAQTAKKFRDLADARNATEEASAQRVRDGWRAPSLNDSQFSDSRSDYPMPPQQVVVDGVTYDRGGYDWPSR